MFFRGIRGQSLHFEPFIQVTGKSVESEKYPTENFFLDLNQNLAVCGDWCTNSRVEGAFFSAKCLSDKIRKIHERNINTNET